MRSSDMQQKRSARVFIWVAFLVGAFALAGCGSDAAESSATVNSDNGVTASADTSGGQISSEDADRLADAQAQLEELQDSASFGSGSGVITIGGIDYSFEANVCYSQNSGFEAAGPGQTADGVPYWATLSTYVATREEMLESGLPQANIDAFFGDRDSIESFTLEVELGKESLFTSADDSMAEYRIDAFDVTKADDLSYTIDGTAMSGSGSVTDGNGVVMDYNETVPVTFSASCE